MGLRRVVVPVLLLSLLACVTARPPSGTRATSTPREDERGEARPGGVEPVVAIAGGLTNTCAILRGGALRCWGRGDMGVTGLGRADHIGDDETPASAGDVELGGRAQAVAISDTRACAILDGGRLRCWGRSWGSDEIIGDDEPASAAPLVDFGRAVEQVALGPHHACVVLDDGSVRCWGWSDAGRLGVPGVEDLLDDVDAPRVPAVDLGFVAVDVDVHTRGSCALSTEGAVRCWGERSGELVGYPAGTGSCTSCEASPACCIGDHEPPSAFGDLPLGARASQLSMAGMNACALVTGDAVRCWGAYPPGLGYPELIDLPRPMQDLLTSAQLGDQRWGEPIREVVIAGGKVCTLAVSGKVRCWGHDPLLRPLGARAPLERPPAEFTIDLGHPARALAGTKHICALLETGTLRCWGSSDYGQLGYANRHIVGDDESPASMGDVDVAGILEPARPPQPPSDALLERLSALHLRLSPIEIDGAPRHHASLEGPPPKHIGELVDALAAVETLRSLDLSGIELTKLDEVGRLTRLIRLDVSSNPLHELEPLRRMKELAELDLSETRVGDLGGLHTLESLTRLRAANTPLRYINALLGFSELRELDLEYTQVEADDPVLESLRARLPQLQLQL